MSGIVEYLEQIISARYGRDVRQAIHDGIQQCYEDGKSGAVDLIARQMVESLESSIDGAYTYTDSKIAELINGAPSTLDTLKEIADAMAENEDVVEALEESIGSKANADHTHNQLIGGEYRAVMQNDGNLVVYDGSGAAIWNSKAYKQNKGDLVLLSEFTGTSETTIDLSSHGLLYQNYSLFIAELFDSNWDSAGTTTFPPGTATADQKKRYVYGSSSNVWGSVAVRESSIICNRTSATTGKMRVYGIRS